MAMLRARATIVAAAVCLLALGAVPQLAAQDAIGVVQLTGTLAKIKLSKTVAIGYRDASVPFSYADAGAQPRQHPRHRRVEFARVIRCRRVEI